MPRETNGRGSHRLVDRASGTAMSAGRHWARREVTAPDSSRSRLSSHFDSRRCRPDRERWSDREGRARDRIAGAARSTANRLPRLLRQIAGIREVASRQVGRRRWSTTSAAPTEASDGPQVRPWRHAPSRRAPSEVELAPVAARERDGRPRRSPRSGALDRHRCPTIAGTCPTSAMSALPPASVAPRDRGRLASCHRHQPLQSTRRRLSQSSRRPGSPTSRRVAAGSPAQPVGRDRGCTRVYADSPGRPTSVETVDARTWRPAIRPATVRLLARRRRQPLGGDGAPRTAMSAGRRWSRRCHSARRCAQPETSPRPGRDRDAESDGWTTTRSRRRPEPVSCQWSTARRIDVGRLLAPLRSRLLPWSTTSRRNRDQPAVVRPEVERDGSIGRRDRLASRPNSTSTQPCRRQRREEAHG